MSEESSHLASPVPAPRRIWIAVGWGALALPFVVHLAIVVAYAVNVPHADDYDVILWSFERWERARGAGEHVEVLIHQHNEHRLLLVRLVCFADRFVFGDLDFRRLILYGNAAWCAAVGMLVWSLRRRYAWSAWELAPISYLMFTSNHYDNYLWATSAIQNYGLFLFAIPLLICAADGRDRLASGLFSAAMFTSGGALPLVPAALGEMLRSRRWKGAIFFAGTAAIVLGIYFTGGYHRPVQHPTLVNSLQNPARVGQFFLAFLGGAAGSLSVAMGVGGLTALLLVVGIARHWSERFLCLLGGFVLIAAVAAALARSGLGVQTAMSSRYAMYHQLAWSVLYAFLLRSTTGTSARRWVVMVSMMCAVGFYSQMLRNHLAVGGRFDLERWQRTLGMIAFQRNNESGYLTYPVHDEAVTRLREALRLKTYDYTRHVKTVVPPSIPRADLSTSRLGPRAGRVVNFGIDSHWAALTATGSRDTKFSLILDGGGDSLPVLPLQPIRDPEIAASVRRNWRTGETDYRAFFPQFSLPEGQYHAGILQESGNESSVNWTNLVVHVTPEGKGTVQVQQK